jgi:hypothetical protein
MSVTACLAPAQAVLGQSSLSPHALHVVQLLCCLQVLAMRPHPHMVLRRPTCHMAAPQATGRLPQQHMAMVVAPHTRQLGLTSSRAMVDMGAIERQGNSTWLQLQRPFDVFVW